MTCANYRFEVMYFGCFGFKGELGFLNCDDVVVVCPLQPSSSVNPGCPGPESCFRIVLTGSSHKFTGD